jgi:hypothetical protein
MKIFDLNINKLNVLLLPTFLRAEKGILLFLNAFATALQHLLTAVKTNRENNFYGLSITSQICYLEKALNDRFDRTNRGIVITDGTPLETPYIFQAAEQRPLYIFTAAEISAGQSPARAVPLWLPGEAGGFAGGVSFYINVPANVLQNSAEKETEILAFAAKYKLVGKMCKVTVI